MGAARYAYTATLLPNGRVLVAGGVSSGALATAELYDPATNAWTATGTMATARYSHTATLLPNGRVLVVGGLDDSVPVATATLYDPTSGTWSAAGSLAEARHTHTATLLNDGRVLVTGGRGASLPLASAEIYDPASNSWTSAGTMASPRNSHSANLLNNGRVLVVGGFSGSVALGTAELFDPASGTWSSAASMSTQRYQHTTTLLMDGSVLAAGGFSTTTIATAERYDPATNTWSPAGSMAGARRLHSTVRLPDGRVLVAGGYTTVALSTVEIYDPSSGASTPWSAAASFSTLRSYLSLVLLADGRVLAPGGYYFDGTSAITLATVELYEPSAGTWSATASPGSARSAHTATLLPTGQVLITGGATESSSSLNTAELYDAASATWTPLGNMGSARSAHTATLLNHGKVLVAGGTANNAPLRTTELYDIATRSWLPLPEMRLPRSRHTATLLPTGQVLVVGGTNGSQPLASTERYLAGPARWEDADSLSTARSGHTATLLPNGRVLVAGGSTSGGVTSNSEVYNPLLNDWSPTNGLMVAARTQHTATLLPNGQVLVVGGSNGTTALASAELYNPESGNWAATGSLTTARMQHTATVLSDGRVLVTGGSNAAGRVVDSAELYDPVTGTWTSVGSMSAGRQAHTATLLPSTRVLLVGGGATSAELYDARSTNNAWRPQPGALPVLSPRAGFSLSGSGFRGPDGGAGDNYRSTSPGVPFLSVLSVTGGVLRGLTWTSYSDTSVVTSLPDELPFGHYLLLITSRGIPNGRLFQVTDGTPPDTRLTDTPAALTRSAQASFTLASSDADLLGYECRLDGGPFTPCASPASYTSLADGAHTLEVRSVDVSGNVDGSPATHTWTIDTAAPPAPQVVSPASGSTLRSLTPDFSGSAEPGALITVYLDGEVLGTTTATGGTWSLPAPRRVPLGSHEVSATATDAAGNVSARSAAVPFLIESRGYYGWGCTSAPASAMPWALALLGLGLHRWSRRSSKGPARHPRGLGLLLCLCALGPVGPLSSEAWAQAPERTTCPGAKNKDLLRATRLYDDLEYESAVRALRRAESAPNLSTEDRVCLLMVRAATWFGLENFDKAQEDLDKLFELSPEAPLTVVPPSNKFSQLVEERRAKRKPPPQQQPAPPGADQEKPQAESPAPAAAAPPALPLLIGVRGEAELLRPGLAPSLQAELAGGPRPGLNLGGALTVVIQPAVAVRAEARLYPLDLELKGLGWLRPYATLGAVTIVPEAAVGARAGAGVGLQRGPLRFFADVAYERILNSAEDRNPDIVLVSLGIGWLPFAR